MVEPTADGLEGPSCPLIPIDGPRRAHRLDAWTFLDDGDEERITVPHTWNADQLEDDPSEYDRGRKRYRTTIEPAEAGRSRRLLHFEGANQLTEVRVDGQTVRTHRGGYTAFTVDVTDHTSAGEAATLEVVVDNSQDENIPPLYADFTFFGGLYRPVWLIETDDVCLDGREYGSCGVYVDTPTVSDETATVRVRSDVTNHRESTESVDVTHRIVDDGEILAEFGVTAPLGPDATRRLEAVSNPIDDPALWHPDDPACYTIETTVAIDGAVVDYMESPLGIREIGLDEGRVTVNGDPVPLRGTNRHQDRPGLGNALSATDHRDDIDRIASMGVNFLRLAHYPQSHTVLNAADEHGLLLWEEIPVVNKVTGTPEHRENCRAQIREMVHQHYNHPAVGIWGFMNEILLAHDMPYFDDVDDYVDDALDLARELDGLLHEEDPSRLTAMACHGSSSYERLGFAEIPDVLGWNLYQGWYYGEVEYMPGVLYEKNDTRPEQATMISEYGVGADVRLHSANPERWDFTEGYHSYYHAGHIDAFEEFPDLAGTAQWNAFDFASDRREDTIPGINQKGLSTHDREPKGVYHLYRAWQSDDPVIHIASRHWNPRSTASASADGTHPVTVYSNCAALELFVDGESAGMKIPDGYAVTWDISLSPGENDLEVRAFNSPSVDQPEDALATDELTVDLRSYDVSTDGVFPEDGLLIDVGSHREIVTDDLWAPDQAYAESEVGWGAVSGERVDTKRPIHDTDVVPLYQHALDGLDVYRVDVPPGTYRVELGVCEFDHEEAGERVFSVTANGDLVVSDLDPVSKADIRTPVWVDTEVEVADGGLELEFDATTETPLLNALRIERV